MDPPGDGLSAEAFRPTERFSDRAGRYARVRPSYPPAAVDAVLEGLGDPARLVAADVGAGTGISARLLADRGVRVLAVEPNRAMREAAAPHERVEWHDGRAEATGLAAGSVDLVVCAQAFHWFDVPKALAELHRVLRPGGRLAVVWNEKDPADPFTSAYYDLVRGAAGPDVRWPDDPDPERIQAGGLFRRPDRVLSKNAQSLDEGAFLDRALSASYVPLAGPRHEELVRALRDLHRRGRDAEGRVVLAYVTHVVRATRVP